MYGKIVRNQYIGKSKLDFELDGMPVNGTTLIGDIAIPLEDPRTQQPLAYNYPGMPDYYLIGKVNEVSTIELCLDKYPDLRNIILCITGIPKKEPLDKFRLKHTIWSSYYEDNYRGYLFQVLDSSKIELNTQVDNITVNVNIQ